jgi:beta-glucosidase
VTAVDRVAAGAAYRDATLPVAERVADLLARMTPEEKIAQLGSAWVFQLADRDHLNPERAPELLRDGLGQVTRISGASSLDARAAAALANEVQRHLATETRLGIPAIVHEEICSGLMARDATIFPQAIGVASTWQPELMSALADAVRVQMRAIGAHQGLSPVLDICRDPRWGRTEETFGEDPHLVACMGMAFVRGLQSDDLTAGVVATAKHFVGYGAAEGGLNWAPAHLGERELRDVYLHPFEATVRTAGLRSVMNAYIELDGVPAAADRNLLTAILREQWGFAGCVVSDYFAVRQLVDFHRLAADAEEAAVMALTAGLDVELPGTQCFGDPLLNAVRTGRVDADVVDVAVARVLTTKFELGLFEQPFVDPDQAQSIADTPAHRQLARDIARRSLVLLRNDGTLPLAPDVGSIAVIGPNADEVRHLIGDYTYPVHIESLREMRHSGRNVFGIPIDDDHILDEVELAAPSIVSELTARLGGRVRYARGCDVTSSSRAGFDDTVALAASCDVAVMVMGDKAGLTDDCTSGESRDVSSLDLPGVQEDLVRAVLGTGTPVVLVLVAGRPIGSASLHDQCAAVLMAWLPGQEGAAAITDVLTGVANPGGKLPITYPRSVGQIPTFYGHKVSGGRSHWKGDYVDSPVAPLYPFGHGLSYTSFALAGAGVAPGEVSWTGEITTTVTMTNTGDREGDEVLQLYVRDPRASVTRPVLELKGFVRVPLPAGETRTVTFTTPVGQLGFYDRDLAYVVEPGELEVFVGTSSTNLTTAGTVVVVADPATPAGKLFDGAVAVTPAS